jgi:hypothetical protein
MPILLLCQWLFWWLFVPIVPENIFSSAGSAPYSSTVKKTEKSKTAFSVELWRRTIRQRCWGTGRNDVLIRSGVCENQLSGFEGSSFAGKFEDQDGGNHRLKSPMVSGVIGAERGLNSRWSLGGQHVQIEAIRTAGSRPLTRFA